MRNFAAPVNSHSELSRSRFTGPRSTRASDQRDGLDALEFKDFLVYPLDFVGGYHPPAEVQPRQHQRRMLLALNSYFTIRIFQPSSLHMQLTSSEERMQRLK
jgi:hypothetical protein